MRESTKSQDPSGKRRECASTAPAQDALSWRRSPACHCGITSHTNAGNYHRFSDAFFSPRVVSKTIMTQTSWKTHFLAWQELCHGDRIHLKVVSFSCFSFRATVEQPAWLSITPHPPLHLTEKSTFSPLFKASIKKGSCWRMDSFSEPSMSTPSLWAGLVGISMAEGSEISHLWCHKGLICITRFFWNTHFYIITSTEFNIQYCFIFL